jgi:hypothetical protein
MALVATEMALLRRPLFDVERGSESALYPML